MTTSELRAEAEMVRRDAGDEVTTTAALLSGAADEIDRLRRRNIVLACNAVCWMVVTAIVTLGLTGWVGALLGAVFMASAGYVFWLQYRDLRKTKAGCETIDF